MNLDTASQPLKDYLSGLREAPEESELKAFQKLIIRESTTSRTDEPRKIQEYRPPTEDDPEPNKAKNPIKFNSPINTRVYQDLLRDVIGKKNAAQ